MEIQFPVAALSAIKVGGIVVVGGVQATFKTKLSVFNFSKFDLLPAPPSYSLLPVEYMKRLPCILLVPVDASQWPVFLFRQVMLL